MSLLTLLEPGNGETFTIGRHPAPLCTSVWPESAVAGLLIYFQAGVSMQIYAKMIQMLELGTLDIAHPDPWLSSLH